MNKKIICHNKNSNLIFILLVCFSCSRSKQMPVDLSVQPEFSFEDSCFYYPIKDNRITVDLNNPQKASLFEYFKKIDLIPLETNNEVLIGRMYQIIYHENQYYVFDDHRTQNLIHIFDETGKFISKIDKRGQGPGEYIRVNEMIINPFTGNIDLLDHRGDIYSYDLSGNFIKKIRVTDPEFLSVHRFVALNEKTYVFYSFFHQFQIIYYNIEEMKIIHQAYEENSFSSTFSNFSFSYYRGKWYFCRPFDNMTYMLGNDSLTNAYIWDFGKHNYDLKKIYFSEELLNDYDKIVEEGKRFPYKIHIQGQNNKYVIAQINTYNEWSNVFYDKSAQIGKFIKNFKESVLFRPYYVTNEYVLSYCNHEDLDKYIHENMIDESNRKKFRDLMNAKEEENPVLIKYYFK